MRRFRWLQPIYALGWEFWLTLPLLGVAFWFGGSFLTDRLLSQSYSTGTQLQADTQLETPNRLVLAIIIHLYRSRGLSRVEVQATNSPLKTLVFEFPTTDPERLLTLLSKQLGLPTDRIQQLARYRVIVEP